MFPVVSESVFTGVNMSKRVNLSSRCCTLSCNCRGKRIARHFLNTALAFRGRLIQP